MATWHSSVDFGPDRFPAAAAGAVRRRRLRALLLVITALVLTTVITMAYGTGYVYTPMRPAAVVIPAELPTERKALQQQLARLSREQGKLEAALTKLRPKGVYIVIDQTQNRLYLMKDREVLREAVASAGSGMVLREGNEGRVWVFDTPRGVFRVANKITNPVWKKPDWAFVEEGKPIPKDPRQRFDYGVLGEYALYFGNGYMIHGTLYERLLGRSVTHGCIRLGRNDLREVFSASSVGTPIYIY